MEGKTRMGENREENVTKGFTTGDKCMSGRNVGLE